MTSIFRPRLTSPDYPSRKSSRKNEVLLLFWKNPLIGSKRVSKDSRLLEVPLIDPLIISKTKLSQENDGSLILIHCVFKIQYFGELGRTLAEIIKSGSKLTSFTQASHTRMDQSLDFTKKVLEVLEMNFVELLWKVDFLGIFLEIFREKVDFYVTILTFIKNVWNFISVMYHWKTKSAMVRHSVTFCDKVNDSDHSGISSPTKRI